MEIIGDDKRIRALFSETRFADEQAAPSFTATWTRAQTGALKPRRAFNLSFAVATALLVFVLGGLALWSKYETAPTMRTAFADLAAAELKPKTVNREQQIVVPVEQRTRQAQIKIRRATTSQRNALMLAAATREAEKKVEAEAKELGSWQSPTASLLSSSSDSLFKSLPQLNENSTELKSFLPNRDNEKEK
jgi:hypothetical protein